MVDPNPAVQYIAQLKIEKKTMPTGGPRMGQPASQQPKRDIAEISQLTIKAATMEKLVEKLQKHVAIIEED
jgi:hypothetical protein